MNGARRLVYDHALRYARDGMRVLDAATGDGWLARELCGRCHVVAVDADPRRCPADPDFERHAIDLAQFGSVDRLGTFDVVFSIYTLQHLLCREAIGWANLRGCVTMNGRMVVAGRAAAREYIEGSRADQLNGHTAAGVEGLALASGWCVVDMKLFTYSTNDSAYEQVGGFSGSDCGAYLAVCEPI